MLTIEIIKKNSKYETIKFIGHTKYSEMGTDIVCSAATSIMITTVNGIWNFSKDYISHSIKPNLVEIKIKENNDIVTKLINNMLNLLRDLEKDYPKNIKIKEK